MISININNLYDFRKNLYILLRKKFRSKFFTLNKLLFFKKYFKNKFKIYSQIILNLNLNRLKIYNIIFIIENYKFKFKFINFQKFIIFYNIKTILRINLSDLYVFQNYCCINVETINILFQQYLNKFINFQVNTIFQFKERLYNQYIDKFNISKYFFNVKLLNLNDFTLKKNILINFKVNILINLNLLKYFFKMLLIFNYLIIFYFIKYKK